MSRKPTIKSLKNCSSCEQDFFPAHAAQVYCSRSCANRGRYAQTRVMRTCRECRQKFEASVSMERARGRRKFCSKACQMAYRKAHVPPKMKRTYVDGLFSRLVRRRDGRCLYCGTTENLHCAHVLTRDVAVLRADFDNAITLCYRHHLHWWHKDIVGAARWFEETWPGRYDRLLQKRIEGEGKKVDWFAEFDRLRAIEAMWDGKPAPRMGQARRTHCPRGHPLSGHNLLTKKGRACKECHRLREGARKRNFSSPEAYDFYECMLVNGYSEADARRLAEAESLGDYIDLNEDLAA